MYEDSSTAFVALSNPVNLRSFFHDLDEDAIVTSKDEGTLEIAKSNAFSGSNSSNDVENDNNNNNNFKTMNDAEVLRAMLSV